MKTLIILFTAFMVSGPAWAGSRSSSSAAVRFSWSGGGTSVGIAYSSAPRYIHHPPVYRAPAPCVRPPVYVPHPVIVRPYAPVRYYHPPVQSVCGLCRRACGGRCRSGVSYHGRRYVAPPPRRYPHYAAPRHIAPHYRRGSHYRR